jgi:hypothetical protein
MGSFPNLLSLTIISIGRSLFAGIMNLLSIVQQPKNWQKSSLVNFDDDKLNLIGWSRKSLLLRPLGEKSQKTAKKDFTTKTQFKAADRKY